MCCAVVTISTLQQSQNVCTLVSKRMAVPDMVSEEDTYNNDNITIIIKSDAVASALTSAEYDQYLMTDVSLCERIV